jgi:DNA polymerase V
MAGGCDSGAFFKESMIKSDATIAAIYGLEQKARVVCSLFSSGVSAGFPSPAEDHIDRKLDLNELLIQNPAATFFVRVAGDSMTGAGINHGDILVVDRSVQGAHGKMVIAIIRGELTIKQLVQRDSAWWLVPANVAYPAVAITEDSGCEVWGVVTSVIHQF